MEWICIRQTDIADALELKLKLNIMPCLNLNLNHGLHRQVSWWGRYPPPVKVGRTGGDRRMSEKVYFTRLLGEVFHLLTYYSIA